MIDEVGAALKSISQISTEIETMRKNAMNLLQRNKEIEEECNQSL